MPKDTVQDDITFTLVSERTIVNDTVKMVASISQAVTAGMTEPKLKESVREMMEKFIPGGKWSFSNMTRSTSSSGMEQIDLQASARVSEKENYSIEKRTRNVSTEGLAIRDIAVDTTPPTSMIEENESALRVDLLRKVNAELQIINKTMGGGPSAYRVGSVAFQPVTNNFANTMALSPKTAHAATYGSGFGADLAGSGAPDTLGNAVKLTMRATVTYRRTVSTG